MSGFGIGIGSFLEGLTNGANIARHWDKQDLEQKLQERKMQLLENADTRAAAADARNLANDAQDRQWKSEDRARLDEEYRANKPIKDAERAYGLQGFIDKQNERDAKSAAGKAASEAIKSGQFGTFADAWREVGIPQLQQHYLSQGDIASADAIDKWGRDKRIEKGVETFGRLSTALRAGDWNGANKLFNDLTSDPSYMALDSYDIKTSPITVDGKTVGLRGTFKNKQTGEESSRDFNSIEELTPIVEGMFNPHAAFQWNKQQLEADRSAKAEQAKSSYKLSNDIELERVKSAGRIAEERAKAMGPQGIKDYTNGVLKTMQYQSENNPGFARLPAQEQAAQAAQIYESVMARSGQSGGQAQVPTTRNFGVQPQVAPKSIMPAFTRTNPYLVR